MLWIVSQTPQERFKSSESGPRSVQGDPEQAKKASRRAKNGPGAAQEKQSRPREPEEWQIYSLKQATSKERLYAIAVSKLLVLEKSFTALQSPSSEVYEYVVFVGG